MNPLLKKHREIIKEKQQINLIENSSEINPLFSDVEDRKFEEKIIAEKTKNLFERKLDILKDWMFCMMFFSFALMDYSIGLKLNSIWLYMMSGFFVSFGLATLFYGYVIRRYQDLIFESNTLCKKLLNLVENQGNYIQSIIRRLTNGKSRISRS